MQGSTDLITREGRYVSCAARGTSNRIPYAPRIAEFQTPLEIFSLECTHQVSLHCAAPHPPPLAPRRSAPNCPAPSAYPVGGDALPLRAEPPAQTPAKMIRVKE